MATVTNVKIAYEPGSGNTLYAQWTWSKSPKETKDFKVEWWYYAGEKKKGTWMSGTVNTVESGKRKDTYSPPSNAYQVRVRIKPEPTKKQFTGTYSSPVYKTVDKAIPPDPPPTPTVTIENDIVKVYIGNLPERVDKVEIQATKNDSDMVIKHTKIAVPTTKVNGEVVSLGAVTYSWDALDGANYRVRAKSWDGSLSSEWSDWSDNQMTRPGVPSIKTIRSTSSTSVYLEWTSAVGADTYEIQYTTDENDYLDSSDKVQSVTGIENTFYEKTGLEIGHSYFFRVRATNSTDPGLWSAIKSILLGKAPAAPTTWSSTTTVVTGEPLILYWVHNSQDGSSQVKAELETTIAGVKTTQTIVNSTEEDKKDKTSTYKIDTSSYTEGTVIKWRVRTCGVTGEYGDWSVLRTVNVYAKPTIEMTVTKADGSNVEVLDSFPFTVNAVAGPASQTPIGYHLSVSSNAVYETIDVLGNNKTVNKNEVLYSKYFDIGTDLTVEFTPGNVDLENGQEYTIECSVTMNSGLTASTTRTFTVAWTDAQYEPDAVVVIDEETYTANIRPFCAIYPIIYYKVKKVRRLYLRTEEVIEAVEGELVDGITTTTNEPIYSYTDADGVVQYYTMLESEDGDLIEGVKLSVYRREYDGSFVELMTGLENNGTTWITDPHPALDYARYRIVATTDSTGAVSYYDIPGEEIHGIEIVIQWDEQWADFLTSEEGSTEKPPWSGSLLKLPYNIDVSESNDIDVSTVEYIGREHPVTYYGTQLGTKATWNTDIPKYDKETIYALRRLSRWTGDVYVREPSGVGYYANIAVSFSQKHKELVVPVTLTITRVEGKDEVKIEGGN